MFGLVPHVYESSFSPYESDCTSGISDVLDMSTSQSRNGSCPYLQAKSSGGRLA